MHTGGVDLYVGGGEHAVLHLLYARFWHKVLHDLGYVSSDEPFYKLVNQGMIQAPAYTDSRGAYVEAREVVERDGGFFHDGLPVTREFGKIGKSLRNMITPDDMCDEYGADTFRVYEMSMGPLDASRPWETRAVVGSYRFLQRVWRTVDRRDDRRDAAALGRRRPRRPGGSLHKTIDGVRSDFEHLRFNTAVAKLIELNNALTRLAIVPREAVEALVLMVAPLAPHIAEELWARLGHDQSLARGPFPEADPGAAGRGDGDLRRPGRRQGPRPAGGADRHRRGRAARARAGAPGVQRALDGRTVRTVVVRAPRLVNVVPA